jgi:soluble lytic murein transglycosylase
MNAQHYSLDGNFLERFKLLPAVIRAQELLINGQITEARREWNQVTLSFNEDQHYTAAHYAHQIGWDSQAIRSAISAKRWHDLELRFPLSFEKDFEKIAQLRNLNSNWLIAMARQESALTADAVSPAGARGLIQIMPDTATAVAQKHNIAYQSRQQLFDPEKNIELAGAYITSLLERFDGNNIYATAAYNAGPYRVEKWLNTTRDLPIDVWIESIPFYETREYVKNVLAYSVIYAHRRHQYGLQMATVNYLPKQNPAVK